MRTIPSMLVVGIAVAGLAAATNGAFKPEWKTSLKPGAGSNITGTAEFKAKSDKETEAEISIKGATAGAELPWHVHSGKCGSNGPIVGAATAYQPIKVNKDGSGKAEAKLAMATPASGEYFVNVHKSAADLKTIVACGDLTLEDAKAKPTGSGY